MDSGDVNEVGPAARAPNSRVRITSIWPDGSCITAKSWRDLEDQVRARQWHKMSRNELRRTLRERTRTMTGHEISVRSAEQMFRDMEAADLVRLEVREEDDDAADDD